jgi:hypothetical protein
LMYTFLHLQGMLYMPSISRARSSLMGWRKLESFLGRCPIVFMLCLVRTLLMWLKVELTEGKNVTKVWFSLRGGRTVVGRLSTWRICHLHPFLISLLCDWLPSFSFCTSNLIEVLYSPVLSHQPWRWRQHVSPTYETTQRQNPSQHHHYTNCHENLRSQMRFAL